MLTSLCAVCMGCVYEDRVSARVVIFSTSAIFRFYHWYAQRSLYFFCILIVIARERIFADGPFRGFLGLSMI